MNFGDEFGNGGGREGSGRFSVQNYLEQQKLNEINRNLEQIKLHQQMSSFLKSGSSTEIGAFGEVNEGQAYKALKLISWVGAILTLLAFLAFGALGLVVGFAVFILPVILIGGIWLVQTRSVSAVKKIHIWFSLAYICNAFVSVIVEYKIGFLLVASLLTAFFHRKFLQRASGELPRSAQPEEEKSISNDIGPEVSSTLESGQAAISMVQGGNCDRAEGAPKANELRVSEHESNSDTTKLKVPKKDLNIGKSVPCAPKATRRTEKDAVYESIRVAFSRFGIKFKDGEFDVSKKLTKRQLAQVVSILESHFNKNEIIQAESLGLESNHEKALAILDYWMENDTRLRERTRAHAYRGQKDPQIRALSILMKSQTDPSKVAEIQVHIDKRLAEISGLAEREKLRTGEPSGTVSLESRLDRSLIGMVGLDPFKRSLAYDLNEFMTNKACGAKCRIFWGDPGTGKTELAQRISGMRNGFPGLDMAPARVVYMSGLDGKLEVKSIVEQVPEGSMVLVDEADKCLDPMAGLTTQVEATQIHASLLTNLGRKRIFWAFLGSFSARRGALPLTFEMLDKMLGKELAGRIDFMDWCFPNWTLENLLFASKGILVRSSISYEDEALLILANECLRNGSAVRGFENILYQIKRSLALSGVKKIHISVEVARIHLQKLCGKSVA
jgi:hypothetical protein